MLKISIALTGGGNLPRIVGPEQEALEAEFRPLLEAGDESEPELDPTRGGVRRR